MIEAVTICVDFSDYLSQTLPYTLRVFDNLVVVTSHEDTATQDLCSHWGVQCVRTDLFSKDGSQFLKGAAINYGLQFCKGADWLCHLDADIALTAPRTRYWLDRIKDTEAVPMALIGATSRAGTTGRNTGMENRVAHHDCKTFGAVLLSLRAT